MSKRKKLGLVHSFEVELRCCEGDFAGNTYVRSSYIQRHRRQGSNPMRGCGWCLIAMEFRQPQAVPWLTKEYTPSTPFHRSLQKPTANLTSSCNLVYSTPYIFRTLRYYTPLSMSLTQQSSGSSHHVCGVQVKALGIAFSPGTWFGD